MTFQNRWTIENLLNTLGALFVEKEYDQNAALKVLSNGKEEGV